jgi:hypothetical protein
MLRTVQCRPAAACARKSPLRVHSKETRQDKTRLSKAIEPHILKQSLFLLLDCLVFLLFITHLIACGHLKYIQRKSMSQSICLACCSSNFLFHLLFSFLFSYTCIYVRLSHFPPFYPAHVFIFIFLLLSFLPSFFALSLHPLLPFLLFHLFLPSSHPIHACTFYAHIPHFSLQPLPPSLPPSLPSFPSLRLRPPLGRMQPHIRVHIG